MSSARSALYLGTLLILAACGGPDPSPQTATSVRAETPSCAPNCPTTCWVELKAREGDDLAHLWLFDADEYTRAALEGGNLHLAYGTTTFDGDLEPLLPPTIPATLELDWDLPTTFDIEASGLTASVVLDQTPSTIECGLALVE